MLKRLLIAALAAATTLVVYPSRVAYAGGFDELPDQGAQALGRGATFTAKADDTTALYWNVAGLARQRGTKLQLSANVHFNTFYFARSGSYVDDPADPKTPWGGKPYPVMEDKNASFLLPMLVASTDFGYFDRLTVGVGVFGPAGNGRTFQLGKDGKPAPSRYDFVQSDGAVIFPTVGVAYRVTEKLDIGLSAHAVLADLKELATAYADPGGGACKNPEYHPCDAEARLDAKGSSFAGSVGVMYRPSSSLQLGAQVRSPTSITASGEATTKIGVTTLKPNPASVTLDLPWMTRVGARYISMEKTFEVYDLEIDGTFETWGSAQGTGPRVDSVDPTNGKPTSITSVHHWNNTFSVRAGGAYNFAIGGDGSQKESSILSIRAGAFYDSPTTDSAYTRVEVNTMAKIAGTVGLGYKTTSGLAFNVAYAAVGSVSRTVQDGEIRPQNGVKEGRSVDGNDQPLPAVNNGQYKAFTHTISFGIEVNFESLFFGNRKVAYGDRDYESFDYPGAPKTEEHNKKEEQLPIEEDSEAARQKKEDSAWSSAWSNPSTTTTPPAPASTTATTTTTSTSSSSPTNPTKLETPDLPLPTSEPPPTTKKPTRKLPKAGHPIAKKSAMKMR